MSRRNGPQNAKASSSKLRPPEPSSTPPPLPPPVPEAPSFADGAEFIRFDDSGSDDNGVLSDPAPVPSLKKLGKQKETENSKKRKSDTLGDSKVYERNVKSKSRQTDESRSYPWLKYLNWEGCTNAAEMYVTFRLGRQAFILSDQAAS